MPERAVAGSWERVGPVQRTTCGPSADAMKLLPKPTAGMLIMGKPAVDVLSGGGMSAYHYIKDEKEKFAIEVLPKEDPGCLDYGPFHFSLVPFVGSMEEVLKQLSPVRKESMRGGRLCEVEVYRQGAPDGWTQHEVSYDPSIGYLPRFIRQIQLAGKGKYAGGAAVSEVYLADARISAGGDSCRPNGTGPTISSKISRRNIPTITRRPSSGPTNRWSPSPNSR
jgi:hypothetical protein